MTPTATSSPSGSRANAALVRESMAPAVKLYSEDPFFERNLDAIWENGFTAVVYCYNRAALDWLIEHTAGPLHHRHATSAEIVEAMLSTGTSVQTSPHLMLALAERQARQPAGACRSHRTHADRESLAKVFLGPGGHARQ